MIVPFTPAIEASSVSALNSFAILKSLPEKELNDLAELATRVCATPMAAISFLDDKNQWDKSSFGYTFGGVSTERSIFDAFVLENQNVLEVSELLRDERFKMHDSVSDELAIQSLTAVPIRNLDGNVLGTLCVMDDQPRQLDKMQIESMQILANHIFNLLELKRNASILEATVSQLEGRIGEMEVFNHRAAHHLKSPLCTISMMTELFREQYAGQMDPEGIDLLETINEATSQLAGEVDDMLNKRNRS